MIAMINTKYGRHSLGYCALGYLSVCTIGGKGREEERWGDRESRRGRGNEEKEREGTRRGRGNEEKEGTRRGGKEN